MNHDEGRSGKGFFESEIHLTAEEERLLRAFRQFHTMKSPETAACGMNRSEIRVLMQIHSYMQKHPDEEGMPVSTLSENSHMMKAAISRSLKELERQGCILRIQDPDDRRYTLALLKQPGKEKITQILEQTQRMFDLIVERLPVEEIDKIVDGLNKLYQAVSDSMAQMNSENSETSEK